MYEWYDGRILHQIIYYVSNGKISSMPIPLGGATSDWRWIFMHNDM